MALKKYLSFFLITSVISLFSCRNSKNQQQKTIQTIDSEYDNIKKTINTTPSLLIKDTAICNSINNYKNKITYQYKDSTYTLYKKDSSQWNNVFNEETPIQSFWDINVFIEKDTSLYQLKTSPFEGIKIALDAGHLAGTSKMAEIEGKRIKLKHPDLQDSIFFFEGELTYRTVSLLKDSLIQLGAKVFTTRQSNESSLGYTYFEWLDKYFIHDIDSCLNNNFIDAEEYNFLLIEKTKNTVQSQKIIFHKLFKHLDFYHRAKIINTFRPDLTIIVHFNVDVDNKEWIKPTDKNYNMAFVPGAFMEGEIETQIDFNNFVRLSQTQEIKESIILSGYVLSGLKKHTNVDIIDDYSEISYLNDYCLSTHVKGVFSRNLALTRQIKGTICYVEALYQDNFDESLLLNKNQEYDYSLERVREVSNGIIEGITNYLSSKHNQK